MNKAADDNSLSYLSNEKAVKRFVRQMLKNHIFVGNFIEQRYVTELNCYKKIVQISRNEDIFIENLSIAKRRVERFFAGSKWIGITFPNTPGAPVGFNLWVEIKEQIFGTFRFRVKDVEFLEDEVSLKLQIIKIKDEGQSSFESSSNIKDQSNSFQSFLNEDSEISAASIISWRNVKEVTVFMFLLLAAILTGGGQIIKFLLDFILKLLRELSTIITAITPLFIGCFDTLSKMFGYVCFLIAALWKERHSPPKGQAFYPHKIQFRPEYPYENRYKALSYGRSTVTITELPD